MGRPGWSRVAGAAAVVSPVTLLCSWWRGGRPVSLEPGPARLLDAETWSGTELVGTPLMALWFGLAMLVALLLVADLTVRRRAAAGRGAPLVVRLPWLLPAATAATGAIAAAAAVRGLAEVGASAAPGGWAALALGVVAMVGAGIGAAGTVWGAAGAPTAGGPGAGAPAGSAAGDPAGVAADSGAGAAGAGAGTVRRSAGGPSAGAAGAAGDPRAGDPGPDAPAGSAASAPNTPTTGAPADPAAGAAGAPAAGAARAGADGAAAEAAVPGPAASGIEAGGDAARPRADAPSDLGRPRRPSAPRVAVAAGAAAGLAAALIVPGAAATGTDPAAGASAGPFVRVASLDAPEFRGGAVGLDAPAVRSTLVVLDGRDGWDGQHGGGGNGGHVTGTGTGAGIAVPDADGRAVVVARFTDDRTVLGPRVLGVAHGRVAHWTGITELAVTGLRADDPTALLVDGVAAASQVGPDGRLWLRALDEQVPRVLDLAAPAGAGGTAGTDRAPGTDGAPGTGGAPGEGRAAGTGGATQVIDATDLPSVPLPPGDADVRSLVPSGDGALQFTYRQGGYRLEQLGKDGVVTLAGGPDPTCGLVRDPLAAFLPLGSRVAARPSTEGPGTWFAADGRLVLLADGVLRVVPTPLPGPVLALVTTPDGAVMLHIEGGETDDALWRLPDAADQLVDLPAALPGCVTRPVSGPPVAFTQVAGTGNDALGVPLGSDGRWASGKRGGKEPLAVVAPDGTRTEVGTRQDGYLGIVRPDGRGGMWWLEVSDGPDRTTEEMVQLVHGRPGGTQKRYPPVDHPAPRDGSLLVPDLSGAPPLLGTALGAYRITDGSAVRVAPGRVGGGLVGPDGRGWLVLDRRVVPLGEGPAIGSGADPATSGPVSVQLARGTAPADLAFTDPAVFLDGGRTVIVDGDVVLAVDRDGAVRFLARDDRLLEVSLHPVEPSGIVAHDDGGLSLVVLPP